ncbi:cupin domain-containing protein [Chryseobacterium sp. 09-1422]|uniref:Cupin domain-containing protein n=1 Tax=Chryseobacterium kimseyorum TaxID=2984028 RepID=A0ABT3I2V9_9FLAO|nr:cupin domain-containing protein [Chryseobacterium kimseyorum]MCW3170384.1 cupin domain-containing protein [Chryseobacterium kimseyorum]
MKRLTQFTASIVFTLLCQQMGFAQKTSTATETSKYTIENCVNEFDLSKAKKTNSGYQYWFADKKFTEENTLKMSIVEPGKSTHAPHRHPEEEFFYILEGKASFYLDGKTVEVGPNTSLYCPPNSEHGISNAGDRQLKYLVIKKDLK